MLKSIQKLKKISSLHLFLDNCKLDRNSLLAISAGLTGFSKLDYFSALELDLGCNKLTDVDLKSFLKAICNLIDIKSFSLNLRDNIITNITAYDLSSLIKSLYRLESLKINLFFNSIEDDGANIMVQEVSQLKFLSYINLNLGSNNISYKNKEKIRMMIKTGIYF